MSASAYALALALLASSPSPQREGEPLPPGAPTDDYQLTAWCYGALSEYLLIYEQVKPDLVAIDKAYGTSVKNEKEPYSADMAAARKEAKVLSDAVEAAEKASPTPISDSGAAAVMQGRAIWRPAQGNTRRSLARAWLTWALPDRCDTTARSLGSRSALLGQALKYNSEPQAPAAPPAAPEAPLVLQPNPEPGPAVDAPVATAPKP
jgi:hypothetical protein